MLSPLYAYGKLSSQARSIISFNLSPRLFQIFTDNYRQFSRFFFYIFDKMSQACIKFVFLRLVKMIKNIFLHFTNLTNSNVKKAIREIKKQKLFRIRKTTGKYNFITRPPYFQKITEKNEFLFNSDFCRLYDISRIEEIDPIFVNFR